MTTKTEELEKEILTTTATPLKIVVRRSRPDNFYRRLAWTAAVSTFVILVLIGLFLYLRARPAFNYMGYWGFLTTQVWNLSGKHPSFGVGSALVGTVVLAIVSLVIAVPVSIACALFINEYAPTKLFGFFPLKGLLTSMVDLMAAIPSVIYGLWGFFVLQTSMKGLARWLSDHAGFIPGFKVTTPTYTSSFFIAGTLVGIMIMPIITALCREVFSLTPLGEREGAVSLGASRARVVKDVVFPFSKAGMVGAIMLGLGRALGEAIAVSIIISLTFGFPNHILQPGGTSIPALIAVKFGSGGALGAAGLLAAGLVLFVLTLIVNLFAANIVRRQEKKRR
jgi:phosphate transport system permease protein